MTLGAAIIKTSDLPEVRTNLEELLKVIGKGRLHCREMSHLRKVKASKVMATLPIVAIGCISKKSTLGWYADKIEGSSQFYYNKCAHLLLECVGDFVKQTGYFSHQVDVIFEKANFDYKMLSNYIRKIQDNPIGTSKQKARVKLLRFIDPDRIQTKTKTEEPLLGFADLVAHSLYRCVDRSNGVMGITESRYFSEMTSSFYSNDEGELLGFGMKPIHTLGEIDVESEVASLFLNARNQRKWSSMKRQVD